MPEIINRFRALPDDPYILGVLIFLVVVILLVVIRKANWKKQYILLSYIRDKEAKEAKGALQEARRTIAHEREVAEQKLKEIEESIKDAAYRQKEMMELTVQRSAEATAADEKAQAAEKRLTTLKNKYVRSKALLDSAISSISRYAEGTLPGQEAFVRDIGALADEFSSVEPVDLKALSIKDLRAQFRQNARNIQDLCQTYQDKYTTKTNATIYRLVVLALQEGIQNIYHGLTYGNLDAGITKLRTLTTKCFEIAIDGNQTILATLSRFIGQVEHLYIESIKIEYEYYIKRERAKEEQRAIREQMRQEAEERKMLEHQRRQIENEEKKYHNEISRLQDQMTQTDEEKEIAMLKQRLSEVEALLSQVEEKKEEIVTLQSGKAGTVYIISNLGSFGDSMFKIGMTRRLEPMDRVRELGDASVPFPFDVHSMIFSDDAVALEYRLHKELAQQRVNKVNLRKEFFSVSVDVLEDLVNQIDPSAAFERTMLAEQFHQSLSIDMPPDETLDDMLSDNDDSTDDDLVNEEY